MARESAALRRRLDLVADGERWRDADGDIWLAHTGVGASRAAASAAEHVAALSPAAVALVGLAGGLAPRLRAGDGLPIGRVVVDGQPAITALAGGSGSAVEVPRLLHRAADKQALRARSSADVVDMETAAVACAVAPLDLHVYRVVFDAADEDLLPVERFSDLDGNPRWAPLLGWLLAAPHRMPGRIRALTRYGVRLDDAGEQIATWAAALVEKLAAADVSA